MSKGKYNLVCVAHPDDETIFFGGLLLRGKDSKNRTRLPWRVICVTDGNADGQERLRRKQFAKACKALGAETHDWLGFPDIYEKRLDVTELAKRLATLPAPHEIYTHGAIGEYGHPHHQDVSFAVHRAFDGHPRLYSSAYNAMPEFRVQLTAEEFALKSKILTKVYGSETQRFLNLLPSTTTEGFLRLKRTEVEALYAYLAQGRSLKVHALEAYRWLDTYLKERRSIERPF